MQTIEMSALNWEVREAARNMELAHAVWMNTPVHAPNAEQVRTDKDAAARRYTEALEARGQAGGPSYPTWNELGQATAN